MRGRGESGVMRLEGMSKTENYSVRRDAWLIICLSVSRDGGGLGRGLRLLPSRFFFGDYWGIFGDNGVATTFWGKYGGA